MQLDIFGNTNPTPKIKEVNNFKLFDWESVLQEKRRISTQETLFDNNSNVLTYRSGASSKSDILGYIEAQAPIGVCAMDTSAPVRKLIGQYASNGGKCFVDSGAFRAFMGKLKGTNSNAFDFNLVLQRYYEIISHCSAPENLIVVGPDIVGDQTGSFNLLAEYSKEIEALNAKGVKVMVPLQKGEASLTEHYLKCQNLFDFELVWGLPSNAEAISTQEVLNFIEAIKPSDVHFLGCSERDLVHMAMNKSPSTSFSCDATKLRQHVGKNKLLTEMHQQILGDCVSNALQGITATVAIDSNMGWDETEILGDLPNYLLSLPKARLAHFCEALSCTTKELNLAIEEERVWEFLEDNNHGYAEQIVRQSIWKECYKTVSPSIRVHSIKTLATANII